MKNCDIEILKEKDLTTSKFSKSPFPSNCVSIDDPEVSGIIKEYPSGGTGTTTQDCLIKEEWQVDEVVKHYEEFSPDVHIYLSTPKLVEYFVNKYLLWWVHQNSSQAHEKITYRTIMNHKGEFIPWEEGKGLDVTSGFAMLPRGCDLMGVSAVQRWTGYSYRHTLRKIKSGDFTVDKFLGVTFSTQSSLDGNRKPTHNQ